MGVQLFMQMFRPDISDTNLAYFSVFLSQEGIFGICPAVLG